MFALLGKAITRTWPLLLVAWVVFLAVARLVAPPFSDVAQEGSFVFLPATAPSRQGEALFAQAFPDQPLGSTVIVVAERQGGLRDEDLRYIAEHITAQVAPLAEPEGSVVAGVRAPSDPVVGQLLVSPDDEAALVVIELTTEFLDHRNDALVARVEQIVNELRGTAASSDPAAAGDADGELPDGLRIALSGSAVLGRDYMAAESESADQTEVWTVVLLIVLLTGVYRAPLLSLIPLLTLFFAVEVALAILASAADAGVIGLFQGIEVYTTVIAYGAGVDYSLFLISRNREELQKGRGLQKSLAVAITMVGAAVAASAGTQMFGIAMMGFAEFGKFHQAGISISFTLLIVLLAALTFGMPLLRLAGRWAYWPYMPEPAAARGERAELHARRLSLFTAIWDRLGGALKRRPGTIWLATVALMTPPALVAVVFHEHLNYGVISELSPEVPSLRGTEIVQRHFPQGATGPVTVLVRSPNADFGEQEGRSLVGRLTERLAERAAALRIADVRSVSAPLGFHAEMPFDLANPEGAGPFGADLLRRQVLQQVLDYYVSDADHYAGRVTRVELLLEVDPFTRDAIFHLDEVERAVRDALPDELRHVELFLIGPTASIRDLKNVAQRDRLRIYTLVVGAVLLVLVVLLRRITLPIYLVASVLFSYLTTLGVTLALFWALDPAGFEGLDWTVPTFLFTLLVAVGVDYNIFLVTRIDEERAHHGSVEGTIAALGKTGGIISACGFIMAGTFSSLAVGGQLASMHQLGFALAFGLLLDTFVVRPMLVPAALVLAHSGRLGWLGRLLRGDK